MSRRNDERPGPWLSAALTALLALGAGTAEARTLRTITIDGDFGDWADVLLDGPQTVSDRSLAQGDPDAPGQSQRDLRGVAVTWDATNVYFYFTRTGSGTNSFSALFYLDLAHDGFLDAADRIVFFRFTGGLLAGVEIYAYDDGGTPDPLPGDGVTPPGVLGALIPPSGGQAGMQDASGIRFELRLPWTDLGIPAGTPFFVHPSLCTNTNVPGSVEDNAGELDTQLTGVELTGGAIRGAAPGRSTTFAHRMINRGSTDDVLDVGLRTNLGFRLELYSDPNGDGDPADGVLVAVDAFGDGDFTDTQDLLPAPVWDVDGDALPDGGSLAPDASRDWVLEVFVPAGQALGTEESVRFSATSSYRPSSRDSAQDRVRVGLVTVTPPGSRAAVSSLSARFAHEACNGSGVDRVLDVTAVSAAGWPSSLFSDPDGDGDPADGSALTDTDGDGVPDLGLVADGACLPFVAVIDIPLGTPPGTPDTVTVEAADGALVAQAEDLIETTASRVLVRPDRNRTGQRGKTLFLPHEVVNAANEIDGFALVAVPSGTSVVTLLDDPDGDERPADSAPTVHSGLLPADGGSYPVISQVRLPSAAMHGDVELVTVEATSDRTGLMDSALETLDVAATLVYSDPLFARPTSSFFGQCGEVYALSFQPKAKYRFTWLDPLGVLQQASPELDPYGDDSLDDYYALGSAPQTGTWTVRLQVKSGSSWLETLGPAGEAQFDAIDVVGEGARLRWADTGSDIYLLGDDFVGFSEVENPSRADVLDTNIDYVVFHDVDGDGLPGAGDDCLQGDGVLTGCTPGFLTFQRTDVDLLAGEEYADRFDVLAPDFRSDGEWLMRTSWTASCGYELYVLTTPFTVGCTPPPTFGGLISVADADPCDFTGLQLDWAAATDWGVGGGGTYAIWRSTDEAFVPDASTLIASGINGLSYLDAGAAPDTVYHYIVQAESDVTCSTGPNNDGLLDGNLLRQTATDLDFGAVPVASFTHSAPECWSLAGGVVSFTDSSTGPPSSWSWDFDGDGLEDASDPNPSFDFAGPGSWDVQLTVTNVCGVDVVVVPVVVTEVPQAAIAVDRAETCLGESIDFDGTSSSAVAPASLAAWSWDFDGDGTEDSSLADPPPWSPLSSGSFTASLTVTDSEGCADTTTFDFDVHDALVPSVQSPLVNSCSGQAWVTATAVGGLAPYTFVWDILTDDGAGTGTANFAFGSTQVAWVTVTDAAGCSSAIASSDIVIPDELLANTAAPVVDSCTGAASVVASGLGGTPPYSFSWDVLTDDGLGTGSGSFAFGSSQTATVTITDAAGCTAQATSAAIDVPDELLASTATPVVDACTGAASVVASGLGGTPPYSFSWDVLTDDGLGTGSGSFAFGSSQTATVTITDAAGCTAQATSASIDVPDELLASTAAPVVDACTGAASVVASGLGGTPPYSFSWDQLTDDGSGTGSGSFAFGSSQTATVTITDAAGCTAQATSAAIDVPDELRLSTAAPVVDACTGAASVVASGLGGTPPYSFSWDLLTDDGAGTGSGSFAFGSSQTATVTITDAAGCTAQATSAAIDVPDELRLSTSAPVVDACTGAASVVASGLGGTPPYSFSWDVLTDDGSGTGSGSFAFGSSQTATVTITDAAGCTAQATSAAIDVPDELRLSTAAPVVDACTGAASVVASGLGGTPPYSFSWDVLTDDGLGTGSGSFAFGSSQTATVTITDAAGCTAQATSAAIDVPDELLASTAAPVVDACTGAASVVASGLGGTPPYSFSWDVLTDDGLGTGSGGFAFGSSQTATVTITDAAGCTAQATSVSIDVPAELLGDFSIDVVYVSAGVYQATLSASASGGTPAHGWSWDLDGDGLQDDTAEVVVMPMAANETRTVRLTVTDQAGCAREISKDVISEGCPVDLPLENLRVVKSGPAGLLLTWQASSHGCHARYQLVSAFDARPVAGLGGWPGDPAWTSRQPEDADGSDQDESFELVDARPGSDLYFLIRDGGTDGSFAPTRHYGNDFVGP